MPSVNILIGFKCAGCGYEEPIGVDIRAGVILEGAITIICPKCGNITRQDNVRAMVPVRFIPPQKEQL
jgi:predicted RNA-binding Zn-ribbon protein involved in translation (DUF1610 family)